jgi:ASC-1-like (ASCH) protein
MDHVAIMKKSLGMIEKILNGEKTIESRWYLSKSVPWNRVKEGDTIYFKNAGEKVTAKADVAEVVQIENLDDTKVGIIFSRFHKELGINEEEIGKYFADWKDKKYVILVTIENPEKVELFDIDKTGNGIMSAWISVEDIGNIKK